MVAGLEAGIVRVYGAGGQIVGSGFLVGPREVLSCAHVVARALGRSDDDSPSADAEVLLDFPLVAPGQMVAARVAVWESPQPDNSGDIAGLLLAGKLPAGAAETRLVTVDELWSHRFRTFGFPAGYDQGVWVSGRLRGRQAAGWVQMEDVAATGYRVEAGFSGGPVWDDELDGVVGMAVAADARPEVRAAYLIPASTLVRAWPGIAEQARPPCPYRGLFAFREQDAALFFGREETSEQLLAQLTRSALVGVVGASGSGKSSLVFAGVVPRLRQRQGWVVVAMRPAQAVSPLAALGAALQPVLEPGMSETQRLSELNQLEAVLAEGRLRQVVDRVLAQSGDQQLLLVIDQFEELYAWEPAVARQFVDVIVDAAVAQPDGRARPFTVVLTLRADFLGQALKHAGLAKALQDSTLVIGQMTRDQLRRAIVGPLTHGITFESGLVERILDDVGEEAGNLPLLEFALTLLWDRQERRTLTHAGYDAIGGVDGAVAQYAEHVYLEDLSAADREAARRLLVQLVEPAQATGQVRRVARSSELDSARWQLAQRLATTRLLVAGRDSTGAETVELVHEALIPGWARLREWVDADHAFRAWQERLRDNVQAWHDSGQDTGALLRGVPLAEAERWQNQRPDDLGPSEQQYIAASRTFHGRSLRRLRAVSAGMALLLVAALAGGFLAIRESARADQQSRLAISRYLVDQTEQLEQTQPDLALLLGVAAFQIGNTAEAANRVVHLASGQRDVQSLLVNDTGPIEAVAFNPADGRMLAAADRQENIVYWDVGRRERLATEPAGGQVRRLAFSPDGGMLASAGDHEVQLWDPRSHDRSGSPLPGVPEELRGLTFSPDGRMLAGCGREEIVVWDLEAKEKQQTITTHNEWLASCEVGFTSDGHLVYADGSDVVTWDIAAQVEHRRDPVELELPSCWGDDEPTDQQIAMFVPSPTGDVALVVTHFSEGPVLTVLWDLRKAAPFHSIPETGADPNGAAFSPDGRTLAVVQPSYGEGSDHFAIMDVAQPSVVRLLTGHTSASTGQTSSSVALSADGTLAASSGDNTIGLFQGDDLRALPLAYGGDAVFMRDGLLVTASYEHGIQTWDVDRGTQVGSPTAIASTDKESGPVILSPDGRYLATERVELETDIVEEVTLWDVEHRVPLDSDVLAGVLVSGLQLIFSPDGRTLALAYQQSADFQQTEPVQTDVVLWGIDSRKRVEVASYEGYPSLAFSPPDGRRLAIAIDTGRQSGRIDLLDVADPAEVETLATGDDYSVPTFSPDGRWLAIRSSRGMELWDVAGQNREFTWTTTAEAWGGRAVFSGDGRLFAAPTSSHEVTIWEVDTRESVATLHVQYPEALRFSSDGQLLATIGEDGLALQRFDPAWAVQHICEIVHRSLSQEEWNRYITGRPYHRTCPPASE